jgi:hypothetical protein
MHSGGDGVDNAGHSGGGHGDATHTGHTGSHGGDTPVQDAGDPPPTGGSDHTPPGGGHGHDHTDPAGHGGAGEGQHGPSGQAPSNEPPAAMTPDEKAAYEQHLQEVEQRHRDDFDVLKQDPDHKGKVKPSEMDEARVALDLREKGKVPQDIQRPPGANQGDLYSPSTGVFYDIKGVHSDWPPLNNVRDKSQPFKGAYDPANNGKWVAKLEDQIVAKKRTVILDMRNANQAAIDDIRAMIEQRGWEDHIVWYP